jgi:mono/diheme cytochrome c family protein
MRKLSNVFLGAVLGILAAVLLTLVVVIPLALHHRRDLPVERAYGAVAIGLALRLAGGNQTNPLAQNPRAQEDSRIAFIGSCAVCHGASGDGRGMFGDGIYPPASDLAHGESTTRTDGQLFWIIQQGLSFTGMPAFGDQYRDADIWGLVVYIRALQRGDGAVLTIPTPTRQELAVADSLGDDVHRGAAIYFAQGCAECHGAVGEAPGELALRPGGGRDAIRDGRRGMPAYGVDRIDDEELADVESYLGTFRGLLQRGG